MDIRRHYKSIVALIAAVLAVLPINNNALAGTPVIVQPAKSPWMIYVGGVGGTYGVNFRYGATYVVDPRFSASPHNQTFNYNTFQEGYSLGGQLGVQYHFNNSPYFTGITFTAVHNSGEARLLVNTEQSVSTSEVDMNHILQLNYNLDLTGRLGADITPHSHAYVKAGISYAQLSDKLAAINGSRPPNTGPFLQSPQRKDLLGLVLGLGLIYDFNKWISGFAEYDYYSYGRRYLQSLVLEVPAPATPTNIADGHLDQHAKVDASAIRLGLNVKFLDNTFVPIRHLLARAKAWMFYLGGFWAPNYDVNFRSGGVYLSSRNRGRMFNKNTFQLGQSLGAQLGVQYHFNNPYFIGMVLNAVGNEGSANSLTELVDNGEASNLVASFGIDHEYRIRSNYDLSALFGADITARTHVYVKAGLSYAYLQHELSTILNKNSALPVFFLQDKSQYKDIWGWLVGLGLSYDISKIVNMFAEYDRYSYGDQSYNTLYNIDPSRTAAAQTDLLTQPVSITANTVRIGLNIKLRDAYLPTRKMLMAHAWRIYMGGFAGYYRANFAYAATYFATRPTQQNNQVINNNVVQQGVSGGGQLGFQYHSSSPYFIGAVFSIMRNGSMARLTNNINSNLVSGTGGIDLTNEFQVRYNLDIAAVLGADITSHTHLYTKLGATDAKFEHRLLTTISNTSAIPTQFFANVQKKTIWGWVFGLGATHDLCKWVNVFAEYDHYDYGRKNLLNSFGTITPNNRSGGVGVGNHITQRVGFTSDSARVGFNFMLDL